MLANRSWNDCCLVFKSTPRELWLALENVCFASCRPQRGKRSLSRCAMCARLELKRGVFFFVCRLGPLEEGERCCRAAYPLCALLLCTRPCCAVNACVFVFCTRSSYVVMFA